MMMGVNYMIGIYKKRISDDEFLFLPKEVCAFSNKNGIIHCKGKAYFSAMTPVVVEAGEEVEGMLITKNVSYPIHNKHEALFFLEQTNKMLSEKLKDKIISITGYDLISFVRKKDAKKILLNAIPDAKKSILLELISKLQNLDDQKRLFDFLNDRGIESNVIDKVLASKASYEQILKNPFITWTGLNPFCAEKLCDNLFAYDSRRICGFVMYAIDMFLSLGDTYTPVTKIYSLVNRLIIRSKFPERDIPKSFIYAAIKKMSKYLTLEIINDKLCVYKTKVYLEEKKIAEHVLRLEENRVPVINNVALSSVEEWNGFPYNDGQKAAFACLKKSGIKIITGPPGAGKTALIKGLIHAYRTEHPNAPIALSATTGAAAQVLSQSCNSNGQTVHKLLNLRPCGDTVLCKSEGDPIEAKFIVVDEVSMLDLEVASYLLPAVQNGAILILSGDDNQLQSVGYGKVLADLIDCGKVEVYRLTQVMRQSGTICENAEHILLGSCKIKTDPVFFFQRFENNQDAVNCLISRLIVPQSFVLSPVKKEQTAGVFNLNHIIQDLIPDKIYCFSYGGNEYYENDRIIMTETNYDSGYFNGDIGVIRSYTDGIAIVDFTDKTLHLSHSDFASIQLAYSITVHKSQGSEIADVHVILPDGCRNMLTRRILYTAITRAKQRVFIYSVRDAFEYAVKNTAEYKRSTNLIQRIIEKDDL